MSLESVFYACLNEPVMKHRPQTYEEYVDTMRSYRHIPADYRLWKSWQDYYDTLRPERIQLRAEYERQLSMRII